MRGGENTLLARAADLAERLRDRSFFRRVPQPWWRPAERYFASSILFGERLRFVLFWGAGRRRTLAQQDRESLDFVQSTLSSLAGEAQLDCEICLILADLHAQANGYEVDTVRAYLALIEEEASSRSIKSHWLSDDMREFGGAELYDGYSDAYLERGWSQIPKALKARIVEDVRHVAVSDNPMRSAKRYVAACSVEALILERLYGRHLFVTFSPPDLAFLLPSLPTLFMFCNSRRESRRPWFR